MTLKLTINDLEITLHGLVDQRSHIRNDLDNELVKNTKFEAFIFDSFQFMVNLLTK